MRPGLTAQHLLDASLMNSEFLCESGIAQVLPDVHFEAVTLAGGGSDLRHIQRHELGLRQIQATRNKLGATLLPLITVDAVL